MALGWAFKNIGSKSQPVPPSKWRMIGSLVLTCLWLVDCQPLLGPQIPYVEHFRQIPDHADANWLGQGRLQLEPFVSGSIHTPTALNALPAQFHAQYPDTSTYRPLWARERDLAVFLHEQLGQAVDRRLRYRSSSLLVLPGPDRSELGRRYQASGHLELGGFRPILFDSRAQQLGEASTGDDQFAPFRKAFLVAAKPTTVDTFRIVTGYFGLHCRHELLGRNRVDRVSTTANWLVALIDPNGQMVAQAYVGTASEQFKCPVPNDGWAEFIDSLADQLIDAMLLPRGS